MRRQMMIDDTATTAEFVAIVDAIAGALTDAEMNDHDYQVDEPGISDIARRASLSYREVSVIFQHFQMFSAKQYGMTRSEVFLIDVIVFGMLLAGASASVYLASLLI